MSNPTGATISTSQASLTIEPKVAAPSITISNVSVPEPAAGKTGTATFTLTLSRADTTAATTVNYSTQNDTALAGTDYGKSGSTAAVTGTATFAAGSTTTTITVPILADSGFTNSRDFFLNLTSVPSNNATISVAQATATIVAPQAQVSGVLVDPATGDVISASDLLIGQQFDLEINVEDLRGVSGGAPLSDGGLIAAYENITFNSAIAQIDGAVTYGPDFQNASFDVPGTVTTNTNTGLTTITDIGGAEANFGSGATPPGAGVEQLLVTIPMIATGAGTLAFTNLPATPSPTNASLYDILEYNNTNNPVTVSPLLSTVGETSQWGETDFVGTSIPVGQNSLTISASSSSIVSSNSVTTPTSGTVPVTFYVTRSFPDNSSTPLTVTYTIVAGTAVQGTDYTTTSGVYTGTLTFPITSTTNSEVQTITVNIPAQFVNEPNKTFSVVISNPNKGTITSGENSVTTTIVSGVAAPEITAVITRAGEGNPETVTVDLVNPANTSQPWASGQAITVNYSTSDGTALAGTNYVATAGTLNFTPPVSLMQSLTFTPGTTQLTFTVDTLYSSAMTANLNYLLNLTGATNATVLATPVIGQILFVPRTSSGIVVQLQTVDANGNPDFVRRDWIEPTTWKRRCRM